MMTTKPEAITEHEVRTLVESFWHDVRSGQPGSTMEHYFIGAGHVMIPDGGRLDLESHQALHRQLCDEVHTWKNLTLVPVFATPPRAHAAAVVHWEASFADGRPGRIRADVQEQWLFERCTDGQVRFVLYRSAELTFAEDSAELVINP